MSELGIREIGYAIEDEYDIAAGFLSTVIGGDDYGMQLFGFRNRAMLDSDLIALRPYLLTLEPAFDVETEGFE